MSVRRRVALSLLAITASAWGQTAPAKAPPAKAPPAGSAATNAKTDAASTAGGTSAAAGAKRQVFILPMKGMVGAGLRHEEMEKVEKEADKFGPGQIIVLRINSGGGDVTEGDRIVRTLSRIRDKHRLVAWLEEAISGAAFTAFNCREIYFLRVGTMGSITKFSGDGSGGQKSAEGRDLEAWIERVAEVAAAGGHDPQVARAMVYSPIIVSYTKDPKTGKVTFYPDKTGEVILSDEKDNLTFNADSAMACGYINGVADTDEELFKAMQLVPGTFVVNDFGKRTGEGWDRTIEKAKKERADITQDLGLLRGGDAKAMQKKIALYQRMQDLWRKAPPVAEGIEGGGPLLPPDVEELAPDLISKYMGARDGTEKAKVAGEAIDRSIAELKKKIAAAKKGG
jgi:hypothetical protein